MRRLTSFGLFSIAVPALLALPVVTPSPPAPRPVEPVVQSLELSGVDEQSLKQDRQPAEASSGRPFVLSTKRYTGPFSTLGVTWAPDTRSVGVRTFVRTRADGRWTDWSELDNADGDGPDQRSAEGQRRSVRSGTAPAWVGLSDGVQVRLDVASGPPPRNVALELVDAGDSPADATLGSSGQPWSTATAETPEPAIISRAEWGADESIRGAAPSYAPAVKVAYVHHTASTNNYTPEQAAAQVRGFYAYHVKSLGWSDIGYNFLVDRFGRIYEGRYGGLDRAVIGAHAGGFNTGTTGVSMIGNNSDVAPSSAQLSALQKLLAWKLSLDGADPMGTAVLTSGGGSTAKYPAGQEVRVNVIAGHRDTNSTACPGDAGYAHLPAIRSAVAEIVRTQNVSPIAAKHAALGGDAGLLGPPTGPEEAVPGGLQRAYSRGTILWSRPTRAKEVHGGILDKYRAMGASRSVLGFPITDETDVPGGRASSFTGGLVAWSPSTGSREVHGGIYGKYVELGGPHGPLGLPTTDETGVPGGAMNGFQGANVYWSASTGAREVHGAVLGAYLQHGGPSGWMGLPLTDELGVPGGRGSVFGLATIYWSPGTGAREVHGSIRERYLALNGPGGFLGLPKTDEIAMVGGARSEFPGGHLYWSPRGGTREVHGAILGRYLQSGGATALGFPLSDERPVPGGAASEFERAVITYDAATGATQVHLK